LLQEARAGNRFIVVIDEAQNLDSSVLESVRLLSDFETPRAKLMTIILAGQPELAAKLASPSLVQLRQRISIVNRIEPLPAWELKNYIEHRLKVAGYEGESIFTDEALVKIADFTEGIPRNINNFCFNALSLVCALRQKRVDLPVVEEVISDLDITKHLDTPPAGAQSMLELEKFLEPATMAPSVSEPTPGESPAVKAEAPATIASPAAQMPAPVSSVQPASAPAATRPTHTTPSVIESMNYLRDVASLLTKLNLSAEGAAQN
jgi:hypothetical protein